MGDSAVNGKDGIEAEVDLFYDVIMFRVLRPA